MLRPLEHISAFFSHSLWRPEQQQHPVIYRWLIESIRLIYVLARDLGSGQLSLRAMGLVYTTLLSIVPLLAVSFSVLKAFGVQKQIEPLLLEVLSPLGDKGAEIAHNIISFVSNINVGVLGSLGLALLLYTVVSLISKIEDAFNFIWRIKQNRSFTQRFSYYLGVLMIGPVLVFSAMGLTASMMNASVVQKLIAIEPFGALYYLAGLITPYLMTILAFVFVYIALPNTTVRFKPALSGAIAAGLSWKLAGWLFASFIALSTKYHAIYSGFAVLIFFMVWIYVSWLIFLLGAQLSFYLQHREFIKPQHSLSPLGNLEREKLALSIIFLIGEHFINNKENWSQQSLATHLNLPEEYIQRICQPLIERKLLNILEGEQHKLAPARSLNTISLYEVISCIRNGRVSKPVPTEGTSFQEAVDVVSLNIDRAIRAELEKYYVSDWINNAQLYVHSD